MAIVRNRALDALERSLIVVESLLYPRHLQSQNKEAKYVVVFINPEVRRAIISKK